MDVHPRSYVVLRPLSESYPTFEGRLPRYYSPVRRFTPGVAPGFSLDLHVLGAPPALALNQDQILQSEDWSSSGFWIGYCRKHDGPGRETTAWSPRFTPHPSAAKFSRIGRQSVCRSLDVSRRYYSAHVDTSQAICAGISHSFFPAFKPRPGGPFLRVPGRCRPVREFRPPRVGRPRIAPPAPAAWCRQARVEESARTDAMARPPRACTYSIDGVLGSLESLNRLPGARFIPPPGAATRQR